MKMCVCVCVCVQPSSQRVAVYLTHLSAIAFPLHLPGVFAGLQALWK